MSKQNNASNSQTRRQFLARSSMLAGASVAATLDISRGAYAAGSDLIKIGLIGCGGRGSGSIANALSVNPGAQLYAMADAFADRLDSARTQIQQKFGNQMDVNNRCFSGFEAAQKLIESGVQVALLTTPPHFRPMHLEVCVEAGVHVFAEKPMAIDAPGVRRVLAAGEKAREKKLSFVSGFQTRYSPGAREEVKRVHDGEIGDVIAIEGVYNTGPLWYRGHQPEWTEMEFQMRNWYYFTWLSGDHLVEQHVHFLDLVNWLMHEKPPLQAWGYGGRSQRVEAKFGDIFDHHSVVYEYADGPRVYALTRQQSGCFDGVYATVFGTKGQLRRGGNKKQSGIFDIQGQLKWQAPAETEMPEVKRYREMFTAMQAGAPLNDSLTMARSSMLAILGRMATHSGQRITWEEAWNSNKVMAPERYDWAAKPPVVAGADGSYPHAIPGVTEVL